MTNACRQTVAEIEPFISETEIITKALAGMVYFVMPAAHW